MTESGGGRTIVVTGASAGIGLAAATTLASRGDRVVLVGRNRARLEAAGRGVSRGAEVELHQADFSVLAEVRTLANVLRERHDRIDVLVNNAGFAPREVARTIDGFDTAVQVNHLAGFLLSHLLLDALRPDGTGPARIITTASSVETRAAIDPVRLEPRGQITPWRSYAASKQANILFTAEAARRWASLGIVATCFHPGVVRTRLAAGRRGVELLLRLPFFRTPVQGADTLVWLATASEAICDLGGYFANRQLKRASSLAADPSRARLLWESSRAAVGLPPES